MKHTVKLVILLSSLTLVACGGASKKPASKAGDSSATTPAATEGGVAEKIERTVTKATAKDFGKAVAYFQEQAQKGWSNSSCKEAANRFEEVVAENSKMVEARFNAGLSYQACNMNGDAEKQYNAALKITRHAPSLSNLGEIAFKSGNESKAKDYWTKAVAADGRIVAARNNLAWLMIRDLRDGKASLKATQEAVKSHLSRALAVDNDDVEAYTLYGLLYLQGAERNKSRLTLSRLLLDKAEELNSNYAPLHNAKGLLQLKRDNVPQALESFRRAVQLDPKFKEAHRNWGNIVLDFRKYEEAKSEFAKVLELDSKDYDAHIGMGYALRGLKDYDGAEKSYNAAKKLDGNRAEAEYNLGVLYQDFRSTATEDLGKAKTAFTQASGFFKSAMGRKGASKKLKKEAAENIKVCEKNVKNLQMAIEFQKQTQGS